MRQFVCLLFGTRVQLSAKRVDLAILLVLQPEWRNEVAFIKRPGPGVRFKVFACMPPLTCQGCRDTLTSCQVAAAREMRRRRGGRGRGGPCGDGVAGLLPHD